MKNYPSISVVMPVYNCAKYVREAIESILNQTYQDFEFIIVNDGSTDNTQGILNEYANKDKRIKLINQSNQGIVLALNNGLSHAKGEWIARLDADDIAMPERLEQQLDYVKKRPEVVLLGSGYIVIDQYGNEIKKYRYPSNHKDIIRQIEVGNSPFPHSSAFFRKSITQEVGLYRNRLNGAEDCDLWLRIGNSGLINCMPMALIKLRKHHMAITANNARLGIISTAARVSHFCRKTGLPDPSEMMEEEWKQFLEWIENKLREASYFDVMVIWEELRNCWYKNLNSNIFSKVFLCLFEAVKHPKAIFYIMKIKLFGTHLPKKLAEESRSLWSR